MTQDRILSFLAYFYQQYLDKSYTSVRITPENPLLEGKLAQFDMKDFLLSHLDIYLSLCEPEKEYQFIYNVSLFTSTREEKAEAFNELQLFLIENIQLFFHSMAEATFRKKKLIEDEEVRVLLSFAPIDNRKLRLVELVYAAEDQMKADGLKPPAMG